MGVRVTKVAWNDRPTINGFRRILGFHGCGGGGDMWLAECQDCSHKEYDWSQLEAHRSADTHCCAPSYWKLVLRTAGVDPLPLRDACAVLTSADVRRT